MLVDLDGEVGEVLLDEALNEGPFLTANLFFFKACCIAKSTSRLHPVSLTSAFMILEEVLTPSRIFTHPSTFSGLQDKYKCFSAGDLIIIVFNASPLSLVM